VAIREQQHGIAVQLPETAQQIERCIRQGNETVFIALGITDMDALTLRIHIAHFKTQPFAKAQAQAQAVDGEIEDAVTKRQGRHEQSIGFIDSDDIRQALCLRRLDQVDVLPGLMQHVDVVELQPVQIELDGAPGVSIKQIGEVVGQLLFSQVVDLFIKIGADVADGAGVGSMVLGCRPLSLRCLRCVW